MQSSPKVLSILMAGALALLAGCADEEPAVVPEDTIRLMFIGQLSDTANASPMPESAAGVEAAVARVNAQGGLAGKKLELQLCDDHADANDAAKCARRAVREGVVATLGNNSNYGEAIFSVLEPARIASIGHNPLSPPDFANPVAFPLQAGAPGMVAGAAKLLADQLGAQRIHVAAVESPAGSLGLDFAKLGIDGTGAEVTGITLVPIGSPDYDRYVLQATRDSDGVVLAMNADQAARFIRAMDQSGADVPAATMLVTLPQATLTQLAGAADGIAISAPFLPIDQAEGTDNARFLADMRQYAPDAALTSFAQQGWLSVEAFVKAMEAKQVTAFTRQNVLAAMNALTDLHVSDLVEPLTTTVELEPPFNRLFLNRMLFARVQDGKIVLIDDQWHDVLF